MDEVKVKVKLTNGLDEMLMWRGQLAPEKVRQCEVEAIVDRRLMHSVISVEIAEQLGLTISDKPVFERAGKLKNILGVTEVVFISIKGRETATDVIVHCDKVLIGHTTLASLDLVVDIAAQRVIANPKHPNRAVLRV